MAVSGGLRLRIGLAAALGLAPLLGLASCKRDTAEDANATAALPLTAELWIAPVADDHPWVIALVTQISIARPPGVDARLEGLTGPRGTRAPNPIIEAEDRPALAAFLAEYEAEHPRPPELRAAWEPDPFGPDNRVRFRLHFLDHSQGFAVDGEARARIHEHDHGPVVHVQLGSAQTGALEALSSEHLGHRIGFALDDEVLTLPLVMEPVPDGDVHLLTRTSEDPALTAGPLLTRLTTAS